MCTNCGCGEGEAKIEGDGHTPPHRHADGTVHSHAHGHDEHSHENAHAGSGAGVQHAHQHGEPAHAHVHTGASAVHPHLPGTPARRMVQVEEDILSKNNAYADANRRLWGERGIFAVNLVSSPGAGKTTLLVRSIEKLKGRLPLAVIEGDQQTSNDAERIRATGATAIQINTGTGCHLEADMVGHAFERINVPDGALLFIENVGNLVCPAEFDLGEAHKVVILSVTEGEDKPLKYPNIFAAADLMVLTKIDLLPHVQFDVGKCVEYARRVNSKIEVLRLSSVSGAGMDSWLDWLDRGAIAARAGC
jgi:hydrogenase nickel incorporation protein HypB